MTAVRRTISLPPVLAARLDAEAQRRGVSFSAVVADLAARQPSPLPYAALIDDDHDLSLKVEDVLSRLGR